MIGIKYKNKKTVVDGMTFDSKKEADRYCELKILQKIGEISDLKIQVPFQLIPKNHGERAVKYIADFTYIQNQKLIIEDVKGCKTREYILKRKLFKYLYCNENTIFKET